MPPRHRAAHPTVQALVAPADAMQDNGTLVLTDLVDSTALTERLGDAAMSALWARHDRTARDLLRRWGGREIDKSDGFLLLFDAPRAAVGYVADYHRALAQMVPPMRARAGIHAGALTLRPTPADDIGRGAKPLEVEGLAKSLVARVMALAMGGQTLVTAAVQAALEPAQAARSHGHWQLKGIAAPIELFEVGDATAPWAPPPDSDKAFRVLARGDVWTPVREVPHNLPAERDGFVGRHDALRALDRARGRGARLVSLLGTGGSGKTRLAIRHGWHALGSFAGGVYLCDLSAARSLDGIAYAVADALGVPLDQADPVSQLAQAIAGRGPCLVILDNFEQVARHAEASLGVWMERAPEARFLVTTREVLGIAGEETLALDPLDPAEGVELFRQRARAAGGPAEPPAADDAAAAELVRMLDGLPLAIELAAARVRTMSPRTMLARMHDRFAVLWSRGGRRDRQSTLRDTFDWSWELLDATEKAALAQLSVFRGGFTLEGAEAVLRWPADAGTVDAINRVQALVDKSLVRRGEGLRLALLESVREYAAEHLRTAGRYPDSGPAAQRAAEQRHGAWCAALDGTPATAVAELDNLAAACRRAVERDDAAVAVPCLRLVWTAIAMRGPFRIVLDLAEAVQTLAPAPALRAEADYLHGCALAWNGRSAEAMGRFEAAASGAEATGQPALLARVLHRIAVQQAQAGELARAEANGDRALALARASGDTVLLCGALNSLGEICDTTGRAAAARRHYEDALALARAGGHDELECLLAGNLAQWHANQGHHRVARELYALAMDRARAVGNRQWQANTRCNLGLLLQTEGRLAEAEVELQAARSVAQDLGDTRLLAVVRCNLGLLAEARGDPASAAQWHADAATLARASHDRRFEGLCLTGLGRAQARLGQAAEAQASLDAADALLSATGDRTGQAIAACARAEAAHLAGRPDAARAALQAAETLAGADAAIDPASELGDALRRTRALLPADAPVDPAAAALTAPGTGA